MAQEENKETESIFKIFNSISPRSKTHRHCSFPRDPTKHDF